MRQQFSVEIRGYVSHETDFRALLARRPDLAVPQVAAIIDAAFEAFENSTRQKACSITIIGHSDREDRPGLTDAQRRASELQASTQRAQSASAWLLDKVNDVAQASNLAIELEWKGVPAVDVVAIGAGASDLLHPPVTEADRKANRRIVFIVAGKDLAVAPDIEDHNFLFA